MRTTLGLALLGLLGVCVAGSAAAQEPSQGASPFRRIRIRVLSIDANQQIMIDCGRRQKVRVGDTVTFHPRVGAVQRGVVRKVSARKSLVERTQPGAELPPGTRGELLIPNSRFKTAKPESKSTTEPGKADRPAGLPAGPGTGSKDGPDSKKPAFRNKDDGYKPGQPLLQGARPLRPKERPTTTTGRIYAFGDLTRDQRGDYENSYGRVGVDAGISNPFGHGGDLDFDLEMNYRTETNGKSGPDILPRRFSYTLGGTRFKHDRLQFGRFLQRGVPELQVLDGVEWGRRLASGNRIGASFGYMPEPDDDYESGQDLQISLYYEWIDGDIEEFAFTTAYQKTFHNGNSDRDLLLTKLRYSPSEGWDLNGAMWLDLYMGRDDVETSDLEVTQAWLSTSKVYKSGSGMDVTYRRNRFVQQLRHEFLAPPLPQITADSRYDRLTFSWWVVQAERDRPHGRLGVFQDQDGEGWDFELGEELFETFGKDSTTDVALFGVASNHETDGGVRLQHGKMLDGGGRWDALYEVVWRHFRGIANDRDDVIQHRFRYSRMFLFAERWHSTLYTEGRVWDDELSWSAGFYLQRRF